jgi:DNA polymerase III delta subunit
MADLNTVRLNGDTLGFEGLQADALTIPFLTDRRLIIVENARAFLTKAGKDSPEKYLDLFTTLPASSALVFVVETRSANGGVNAIGESKKLCLVMKWIEENGKRGIAIDCLLPVDEDMPAWIMRKAKELGGAFRPTQRTCWSVTLGITPFRLDMRLRS